MKFFFKQLLLLTIIPMIIFSINYSIDYRSDGSRFVKNFVNDLNLKDSLNVYVNFPERLVVKERISRQNNSSTIVLGSSRSMLIGKPIGLDVSNFGVSGALLKDFKFIYHYLKEKNTIIDTVYIEISPWLLNKNTKESRYKLFKPKTILSKSKSLFSLKYFFNNIKFYKYKVKVNPKDYIWYKDGTIKYNEEYRTYDLKKIEKHGDGEVYLLDGFNDLKELDISEFSSFIYEIQNDNIEVVFIKHPYPPLINGNIFSKYPNISKSETLIDSLAFKKNIKVLGSFDPNKVGLENTDYYDGMHLNPNGTKKLLGLIK